MTKGRSTLILLAGVIVLGAFIWIQEVWRARVPSKLLREVRLFNLSPDTLISLQFVHTNDVIVECVKENGVWMTGGTGRGMGRADVAGVHQLVAGLNSMGKGTTITARHLAIRGFNAAEYGFDEPTVEITAVDNTGWHHWLVGRTTPLGDMVYVKEGNREEIYTVMDRLLAIIPAEPDVLRDRTLFPGKPPGIRRIEIRGAGGFVQLLKDTRSDWQIQQPLVAPADPNAVEELLEKLYLLRIADFVAENVSDFSVYGLQGETRQISLGGTEGTSRMLVIGDEPADRPGMLYARRADDSAVFLLSKDVLELVDIKHNSLRDARVLPIPARDISYISITRNDQHLELAVGEDGRWTVTKPVMWAADPRDVTGLIKLWDAAVITEFNVTNAPAVEPEWTLLFGSEERSQTNRVDILPTLGDRSGLFILREGDPSVHQINLPLVPETILDPLEFKDRMLWSLAEDGIEKLSIEQAQQRQVVERQADGSFAPADATGQMQVNEPALDAMLKVLSVISAKDYVAYNPRDLAIYGLAEPDMILHMGLSGTNQLGRVLLVGQEAAEGFYSMVKGHDVVFLLEKSLVELLSADLVVEQQKPLPDME